MVTDDDKAHPVVEMEVRGEGMVQNLPRPFCPDPGYVTLYGSDPSGAHSIHSSYQREHVILRLILTLTTLKYVCINHADRRFFSI